MNFLKNFKSGNSITKPKVLFDHIPKCCGSSLTELFRKAFGYDRVAPTSMGEQALASKKLFKDYDVVIGHFGGAIFDRWPYEFFSCTLIRHPVDRALSTYFYFQNLPNIGIPQVESIRGMTLEKFVNSNSTLADEILNNPLARHFAAAHGYNKNYENIPEVWQAAVNGFNDYDVIGVCEEFEKSVKTIFAALGIPVPTVDYKNFTLNKNNSRLKKNEIPAYIFEAIEHRSQYDLRLYNAAIQRLNGRRDTELLLPLKFNKEISQSAFVVEEFVLQGVESKSTTVKSGETLHIKIKFHLLEYINSFWYAIQVRNLAGEILYGMNSFDSSAKIDLSSGEHEISLSLEILLKHGRYCVAYTLGKEEGFHPFGVIPRWAAAEPVAYFEVLGNLGASFYGAFKLPVTCLLIK